MEWSASGPRFVWYSQPTIISRETNECLNNRSFGSCLPLSIGTMDILLAVFLLYSRWFLCLNKWKSSKNTSLALDVFSWRIAGREKVSPRFHFSRDCIRSGKPTSSVDFKVFSCSTGLQPSKNCTGKSFGLFHCYSYRESQRIYESFWLDWHCQPLSFLTKLSFQ